MPEIMLTGIEAVHAIALKYTWNAYVSDYNTLSIMAYPHKRDIDGFFSTDYSEESERKVDIGLSMTNYPLITVLLDDKDWHEKAWLEHDDWLCASHIVNAYQASDLFASWFEANIKDYVVPIVLS